MGVLRGDRRSTRGMGRVLEEEELINIYEEGIGVKKNPWLAKKLREKYEEAVKQ